MSNVLDARAAWGPLSEPIHTEVPDGAPPWRDNAFLSFWDPAHDVVGTLHVSTSPNAEGRRARMSLSAGGTTVEIVEPLDPGTFSSASIGFDGGSGFKVDSPRLSGELEAAPHFALAEYTGDQSPAAFNLDPDAPLMHFQRAATVRGRFTVDGDEIKIDGHGFRDRTWGSRDESASVAEYFGFQFVFDSFAVNDMRLLGADGNDVQLGFELTDDRATTIKTTALTRDASGLFAATAIELSDGRTLEIRSTDNRGGFWCPMGIERTGPTLSAYDEFHVLRTADGEEGFGMIEQGVVKRVF